MENLLHDIKLGARSLFRDKSFAATVMLTLAICIAAYTATFAIVHSVLLRPLPIPSADEIVLMANLYPKAGATDQDISAVPDYFDRLRAVTALQDQAMFDQINLTLDVNGTAEQVPGLEVTPSFFKLIGIAPARGRAFTPEEGEVGNDHEVILSQALWQQLYGGDPSAIGRELRLDAVPFKIVGIMPRNFVFLYPAVRFWVPLAFTAQAKTQYHNNNWYNIGRLKPGATVAQVQAQVNALNAANLERMPELKDFLINAGYYTRVQPLQHMLVKNVEGALFLLWGGALFVLLIGGLNIANLALARWSGRGKELATRMALGANRILLSRQLIVENVLLAGSGGIVGLLLAPLLLRAVAAIGLASFPRAEEVRLDGTVILVALGLAVAVGVLVGLVPIAGAFKLNLNTMLREGSRTGTSGARAGHLRQGLIGAEVGLAFVLLAGAGLLLASFRHLLAVDPGFTTQGVVTASMDVPQSRYRTGGDLRNLMNRSLDSIRRLPGVTAAGATTTIPFGNNENDSVIMAEGYAMKPSESLISPHYLTVTPGFFQTMKIALVRGRYFDDRDNETAPSVIIVDQQLARLFWPNRDPIGRRMYTSDNLADPKKPGANTHYFQVVGVVGNVRLVDLAGTGSAFGTYYFPYAQAPARNYTFAVRSNAKETAVVPALRTAMAQIDPDLALSDVKTMEERATLSMSSRRTSLLLALAFGGLALFLSAIGIYGVIAYLVAQRRREIAIRMALGSTPAGVVRLVLRQGMVMVALGLAAGFAGATGLQKAIASQIYGVRPLDPLVIGGVTVILGAIALAACAVPTRRAARVDPVAVLKEE